MPTIAPKQVKVGGVQLEAVLAEAAVFSPAKYPGFEARVRRIGEIAEDRLGLDGAFDFALAYSDAEAMSTELVFSAGLEKNVNFGLSLAPFAVPGMVSIARPILYGWLEYVLGGSRNEDIVYPQRDPTQFEMQVSRIFCAYLCEALFGAFEDLPVAMSADVILPDSEAGERQWIRRDLQFGILYEAALGPITGEIMLVLPLRLLDTLRSGERKPAPESDRLPDPPDPGLRPAFVALHQLKRRRRAVAGPERLVDRCCRRGRQAGLEVAPVFPAEAVQPAVPRLEEGDDCG